MKEFDHAVAQVALGAIVDLGFVVAGGHAVALNGIGDRPSHDIDLFANHRDKQVFGQAKDMVREALEAAGWQVDVIRSSETFHDVRVSDSQTGQAIGLQLAPDYRAYQPIILEVGPVLDIRDAVGAKVIAMYGRFYARDFIDVDNALHLGGFSKEELIALGDIREATPMDRPVLAESLRAIRRIPPRDFIEYGVPDHERRRLVAEFSTWADEVDSGMFPVATD